jgi:hypothetical protein
MSLYQALTCLDISSTIYSSKSLSFYFSTISGSSYWG